MTTTHIWDSTNIVLDVTGTVVVKYVRGINLICMIATNAVTYYNFNAHGDVVGLTDTSGVVTKSYRYDAFGVEQGEVEGDANLFRYCGEYWDVETGTLYLRARHYNPMTGRFTQEDPANSGLNWYTYCGNNPIFYFDPSGLTVVAARAYANSHGASVEWIENITIGDTIYAKAIVSYGGISKGITGKLEKGTMMYDDYALDSLFGWKLSTMAETNKENTMVTMIPSTNNSLWEPPIATIADAADNTLSAVYGAYTTYSQVKGYGIDSELGIISSTFTAWAIVANIGMSSVKRFGQKNEYSNTGNIMLFTGDVLKIGTTSAVSFVIASGVGTIPVAGAIFATPAGWAAGTFTGYIWDTVASGFCYAMEPLPNVNIPISKPIIINMMGC